MATLKDEIGRLTKLQHRLAIWEALHAYADENFISRDGRKAPKAIKVPDCLVEVVPEEDVESVLQAIGDGPISELRKQVAEIEALEITLAGGKKDV